MQELFEKLAHCVEFGKIDQTSPWPPDMRGMPGADELTKEALEKGATADEVLQNALIVGMERVGIKFRENKVFVPQVLMSAKAMNAAMNHLKPFFESGAARRKGTFIIGTVKGDLHDIGKNLVSMMVKGNGFKVIDLGTDVSPEKFVEAVTEKPDAIVGLSALLTTTLASMENTVEALKKNFPDTVVCVGGAPVSQDFCNRIHADFYSPDPQGLVEFLNHRKA